MMESLNPPFQGFCGFFVSAWCFSCHQFFMFPLYWEESSNRDGLMLRGLGWTWIIYRWFIYIHSGDFPYVALPARVFFTRAQFWVLMWIWWFCWKKIWGFLRPWMWWQNSLSSLRFSRFFWFFLWFNFCFASFSQQLPTTCLKPFQVVFSQFVWRMLLFRIWHCIYCLESPKFLMLSGIGRWFVAGFRGWNLWNFTIQSPPPRLLFMRGRGGIEVIQ